MSFLKTGRPQHHSKGKKPLRLKRTTAAKKEWVSTVNDLSVHKLTPAELSHRHEIHKSHNKAAAQWELREKALKSRLKQSGSPALLDQTSLNIIREVLSDQMLLQDVLARSDRTLAVVKDLFGDAPRRQIGHPTVTIAPNCSSDSELPVVQRPDPPTQLSLLSQSMMDQQALNELQHSEEDLSDEDAYLCGSPEYPVVRRANVRNMKSHRRATQKKVHVPRTPRTSGKAPDQAALNATLAVERVRPRPKQAEEAEEESSDLVSHVLNPDLPFHQSERSCSRTSTGTSRNRKCVSQISELNGSSVAFLSGDQSTLGLLQTMLGQVEADLHNLGPDSAPGAAQTPEEHRTQGLTGFSVALINTMGRLVQHHKKTEEKIQKQTAERKKLEEELREQQNLINALTAETMTLREEAATTQVGLQQRITELEQKFDAVVLLIGGLGLLQPDADSCQDCNVKAAVCQSVPVRDQTQAPAPPAVLLSPPRQGNDWQHLSVTKPVVSQQQLHHHQLKQQQFVPVHLQASSSSLASLPLTSLPSASSLSQVSEPLSSQVSRGAVQAEIAQLSRQNQMIRAQLSQAQSLRSGVSGSTFNNSSINSGGEETRLSSGLSGRATPQSVVERRTSVSGRTGRQNQNLTVTNKHQTTSPGTLGVNSVEQRLLELNRQSAAARGRLLELIEQQKHSVSSKTSPSTSPIPPSALSPPQTGSPEGLVHVPTKEPQLQTGGDTREAERERDGWFSLTAHVR